MTISDRNTDEYMELSGLEQRKDIEGFESSYQCSNLGRIRSLERDVKINKTIKRFDRSLDMTVYINQDRTLKYKGQIIQPTISMDGHVKIALCKRKIRKSFSVAKLIYCTFEGYELEDFNGKVYHINGDKKDNRLANLLWLYKEEVEVAKIIFSNIKGKGISLDDIYDMLHKLRNRTGLNEQTPGKKALDTEGLILDFIEEKNKGFEDEDDMAGIGDFTLLEFFTRIQKKKIK